MSETARLLIAPLIACGATLALVPLVRLLAIKTSFYDMPSGYKEHAGPTPYLGGIAVVAALLVATAVAADGLGAWLPITICIVGLLLVGTVDDRVGLGVGTRLAAQAAAGTTLWASGLGWALFAGDIVNLVITVAWVVGVVNAFNLMDNEDGAAGAVGASCGIGIAVLAAVHGDVIVAAAALVLAGACVGFLPYNLANPSRIFLGDGGSMPVGFVVAALIIAAPFGQAQWSDLLIAVPLAGIPIFDTALVAYSRYRRKANVLSGARDHLTHRLLIVLKTPARVALVLAAAQLALCGLALALIELDPLELGLAAALYAGAGAVLILVLDGPGRHPRVAEGRDG
jgi:UDP-GlcNAc:undecaprenyl-phosphate/decaprenyl-phosphate GlcNAc-1-phosphate transferase